MFKFQIKYLACNLNKLTGEMFSLEIKYLVLKINIYFLTKSLVCKLIIQINI